MFLEESEAIRSVLASPSIIVTACTALSIASGNRAMREIHQPFIQENVFGPLEKQGILCVHHELHLDDGVDIAGDLYSEPVREKLKATSSDIVLCLNLLEHVPNPEKLAAFLCELVQQGGFLLVTVPLSYQYHADPIDTYYRPTPKQLAELFPDLVTIKEQTVCVGTLLTELGRGGGLGTMLYRLGRHFWRCITYMGDSKKWFSHVHSTCWMFRQRKVSLVLLRMPSYSAYN